MEPVKKGRPPKPKEVTADNIESAGEEIVKTKRRAPGDMIAGSYAKKDDVSRILTNCMKWYQLSPVQSLDELQSRIGDFFVTCISTGEIPTVEKLCLATGYDRRTIWTWETGEAVSKLGTGAMDIIKKAKDFLATFESEMVTEGKINPIVYIFRAKNYFGMKDQQEYVLTPNGALGNDGDPSTIAGKYKVGLPEAIIEAKESK